MGTLAVQSTFSSQSGGAPVHGGRERHASVQRTVTATVPSGRGAVLVHPGGDVSAAYRPRVIQLDVEAARRDGGKEPIEAFKAPLDVSLPSRYDLDRGPMSPRPGPLEASAKCVGERALGAAGARYGVVGNLQLEGGAGWVSVSR
jgi:hypothetical protein